MIAEFTIKDEVRHILAQYPQTRNYRWEVYAEWAVKELWENESFEEIRGLFGTKDAVRDVIYKLFGRIPFETIRRDMQYIQNVEKSYLPTILDVMKQRGLNEDIFRKKYSGSGLK